MPFLRSLVVTFDQKAQGHAEVKMYCLKPIMNRKILQILKTAVSLPHASLLTRKENELNFRQDHAQYQK